ncbi:hypothetical protein QP027_12100 [Corynebacterium breve]|uniref:DUF1206 domain-containing protein n=1 Tax=Corynebacterium breve TaxID=3049799 RepID=A0ABY8VDQ6_9CORY|nr:hypothetical protein [Corynebacterium breve]WIM67794.1 hypothetical protein QP027_12100 [Corynebacterium breve]
MIALWQVIEALVGYVHLRGVRRFNRRVASVGRAFMYLGLGALTFLVALDVELRGNTTWADIVDEALGRRGGRQLIVAVGCVIIAIGIGQMGRGIGRIFVDEFEGPVSRWVVALGLVGYVMLGLSVVLVGGALVWSAISVHPEYAGTISTVIKILVETPLLGPVLGTIVAAGFVSFAVFCIAWSTQPLHATRVER